MLQFVADPRRVLRSWSMLAAIGTGAFDVVVLAAKAATDLHLMSSEQVLTVNAVLALVTGLARLVQQNIPMTTGEKVDAVTALVKQPMKPGHEDIEVQITPPITVVGSNTP